MRTLTLTRFAKTRDGVIGRLGPWVTLEEEDRGNERNVSAIPTGSYVCRRSRYHAGGYDTYEVSDVPGRSRILFHIGNSEEDTAGCILLGERLGVLTVRDEDTGQSVAKLAVLVSGPAFRAFMASLGSTDAFRLQIVDFDELSPAA